MTAGFAERLTEPILFTSSAAGHNCGLPGEPSAWQPLYRGQST
jgi:hypothetical protein